MSEKKETKEVNKLWTVEELAKEWRVSTKTLLRWIRAERLKAIPVGRSYRIKQDEYERGVPNVR